MKEIILEDKRKEKVMNENTKLLNDVMEQMIINSRHRQPIEFNQKVFNGIKHILLNHITEFNVEFEDIFETELYMAIKKVSFYDSDILLVGGYGSGVEIYNLVYEKLIIKDDDTYNEYMLIKGEEEKLDYLVKYIVVDIFSKYGVYKIISVKQI